MKNKYKVAVYAICKNEEKFVDKWVNSMKEADNIYVLDTGSTDNTLNKLKENNVFFLQKEFKNFRFDVARNMSLDMVPKDYDICVCTDLDEVFEPGWRTNLENIWNDSVTRCAYNYNWSLDENNKPLVNFYSEKIHSRNDYIWTHPVHEILTLASIVEHEAILEEDRPKIAKVFLNRLDMGMKLQSCATIGYAINEWKLTYTNSDLAVDSLYNTYKYYGLPVGPGGMPSEASIKAVIYPDDNDYLYFLANVFDSNSKQTYYSKTYAEHQQKCLQYLGYGC